MKIEVARASRARLLGSDRGGANREIRVELRDLTATLLESLRSLLFEWRLVSEKAEVDQFVHADAAVVGGGWVFQQSNRLAGVVAAEFAVIIRCRVGE